MTATAWADQVSLSNSGLRTRPIDNYGKKRIVYFHYKNLTGGTLPIATEIDLGFLPPGVFRILTPECWYRCPVAGGAGATLGLGRRAYQSKYNPNPQALEAEELSGYVSAKDVSGVVTKTQFDASNDLAIDYSTMQAITICAVFGVAVMPINWELEGYITLVTE